MMPQGEAPPPPVTRPSSGAWFYASGAVAMLVGLVDFIGAGIADCLSACDHVFRENPQAKTEAHEAAFMLVLAVVILTGGGLCFAKNRVGAGIVAAAALGNVSFFALVSRKEPAAVVVVVLGVTAAVLPIVAILRRTLAARDG
jgi:hypothetical protein